MTLATVNVEVQCFPKKYLEKAKKLFLHPSPQYPWDEIVSGASVQSESDGKRRMFAVAGNTFRGFHKIDKACLGAKKQFINYFLEQRTALAKDLRAVRSRAR